MKKKTLQVITLGCSKNTVDTEHLLAAVADFYEIVPEGEEKPVDVLLVNTCGFIGDAKEESINLILSILTCAVSVTIRSASSQQLMNMIISFSGLPD